MASIPVIGAQPLDVLDDPRAHQGLAAGQADLADALVDRGRREALDLLEGEDLGVAPRHALGRHAVDAPQVAAVGDGDAQVVDAPAERVGAHRLLPAPVEERATRSVGDARVVVEREYRTPPGRAPGVGDEREQLRRLADELVGAGAAHDLDADVARALEALGEQQVGVAGGLDQLLERALLVHAPDDRELRRRRDHAS